MCFLKELNKTFYFYNGSEADTLMLLIVGVKINIML